jgi:hypothetical protein
MTTKPKQKHDARGEVLIALLKEKSDFAILQEQGWYRELSKDGCDPINSV